MKRVVIIKIGALVRYASKTPKKVLRIFLARGNPLTQNIRFSKTGDKLI